MPLVDDMNEDVKVRQAAIAVLITWHPSSGWYQRLAVKTWWEPNYKMTSYMASVFERISRYTDHHWHTQ